MLENLTFSSYLHCRRCPCGRASKPCWKTWLSPVCLGDLPLRAPYRTTNQWKWPDYTLYNIMEQAHSWFVKGLIPHIGKFSRPEMTAKTTLGRSVKFSLSPTFAIQGLSMKTYSGVHFSQFLFLAISGRSWTQRKFNQCEKFLIYCKIINFCGTFNFVYFVGKQNPRN